MTYHRLCIEQSSAAAETGPERNGGGWNTSTAATVLHIRGIWMCLCSLIWEYANTPWRESALTWLYQWLQVHSEQLQWVKLASFEIKTLWVFFHYYKQAALWVHLIPNNNHMKWVIDDMLDQTENMVPAHGTIHKDSCRCQGHYLYGYQILQYRVQIKFLEAPYGAPTFPWMYGVVVAEASRQQQCKRVGSCCFIVVWVGFVFINLGTYNPFSENCGDIWKTKFMIYSYTSSCFITWAWAEVLLVVMPVQKGVLKETIPRQRPDTS